MGTIMSSAGCGGDRDQKGCTGRSVWRCKLDRANRAKRTDISLAFTQQVHTSTFVKVSPPPSPLLRVLAYLRTSREEVGPEEAAAEQAAALRRKRWC
jgi:hypothetical protein